MSITLPPTASYTFLFRRVAKFCGIADPNSPEGDAIINTAPFTLDMIRKQIIQADHEMCALIASVEGHSYRNQFFTEEPDVIADGARILGFIGTHGGVKTETQAGNVFKHGRLASSFDALDRARNNFTFYGSPYDLYYIDNGVLHIASGKRGKVYVPTVPLADDTKDNPTLFTPKVYQNGVLGHALVTLRPVGVDETNRMNWERIWAGYVQMVMANAPSLPTPEQMQRIAK